MQFYFYTLSFLVLGVVFSWSEYVAINYPIHPNSDDFDMALLIYIGITPLLLMFALVALALMVCEILQPGITLSIIDRNDIIFVSSCIAAFAAMWAMLYNKDYCFKP